MLLQLTVAALIVLQLIQVFADNTPVKLEGCEEHKQRKPSSKLECAENGKYKEKQCQSPPKQCWCANIENGRFLKETVSKGETVAASLNCSIFPGVFASSLPLTECQRQVWEKEEDKYQLPNPFFRPRVGQFIPTCAASGKFAVLQRHSSTGYSWCVDEDTGEKINGTEVAPPWASDSPVPTNLPIPDCVKLQKQNDVASTTPQQ